MRLSDRLPRGTRRRLDSLARELALAELARFIAHVDLTEAFCQHDAAARGADPLELAAIHDEWRRARAAFLDDVFDAVDHRSTTHEFV
jgi:hypothetical protein